MIDVIIPAYNAYETIERTLKSIEKQTIKSLLKVYIVDDCSSRDYNYLKDLYDLDITIYRLSKNGGPGVARQYALDHSNSEYIVFIDSDDIFNKKRSIEILYKNIKKCDMVMAKTYDEYYNKHIINENDLHSKIYRRSFILKNSIKFNETRYHEDNMFNNLVLIMGAKYKIINKTLYIYNNNKNSISRKSFKKEFNNLEILLYNIDYINKFIKNKEYDRNIYAYLIYTKYIYLNRFYSRLNKKNRELLKRWVNKYNNTNIDLIGGHNQKELYEIFTLKKRII